MNVPSFADPANLVVQAEPEFEGESALGLLQAVYKSRLVSLSTRIKCAMAALPFESPKLVATALYTSDDFATLLDKAIERSNGARLIDGRIEGESENRQ
jgi:hypothetical protein